MIARPTIRMVKRQKTQITAIIGNDVDQLGLSYISGRNVK